MTGHASVEPDAVAGLATVLPNLGAPLDIGPITLRNRAIVTAHTTNLAASHEVSDRHVAYHRRRAAGGFGLIITEGLRVHPTSLRRAETLSLWSDDVVPGLRALVGAVRSEGAAIFAQLLHSGREAADDYTRIPSWGPSPLPWSRGAPPPHAMALEEIEELKDCYAAAAWRAAEAGFDGIELHIGHGHLLQQFLSPVTNVREDDWGGDDIRRRRLVEEILTLVTAAVPRDRLAVGIRISADEFLNGGLDLEAMARITQELVTPFSLDFVNVSHSAYVGAPTIATQIADMSFGSAPFAGLPAAIRSAVPGTPVLMACRVETPAQGDALIADGVADAVALTRASIADPDIVRAAASGRGSRRCTACNQLCIGRTSTGLPLSCVVNPEVGLEERWSRLHEDLAEAIEAHGAAGRPRLLVVGAGPAGMEAALAAAPFAEVRLIDRADAVGGSLRKAAGLRNRGGWMRLIEDLDAECAAAGVEVSLAHALHPGDLERADVVIVATGAERRPREIGGRIPLLVESLATDARTIELAEARAVVVYDDQGFWPGMAAVEHLLATRTQVHYVTPLTSLSPQITIYSKYALIDRLRVDHLRVHLGYDVEDWRPDGHVRLRNVVDGSATELTDVDAVVDVGRAESLAPSPRPVDPIVVGDAYAPRDTGHAVWSGRTGGLRAVVRASLGPTEARRRLERRIMALPLAPTISARG